MRRIQFIEIHEQPWFPSFLRDDVTEALQYGLDFLRAYAPIVPKLQSALESSRSRSILDMCSGGGGPWRELSRSLNGKASLDRICLCDKFPNVRALQNISRACGDHVTFRAEPVDAMKVPAELAGFRTVFTSYHHFPPEEARALLQDAVNAGQGIGIFEVTKRAPLAIGLMLPWALLVFVTTLWIRPFRWSRLFWTYAIPVIPFVVWFDGVISCLRSYRPQELREITGTLTGKEYRWEAGEQPGTGSPVSVIYLIGYPAKVS